MSFIGLIAILFVVTLIGLLVSSLPPFADLLLPMDPVKLIAVVLTFTATFGVFLFFESPPIAALLVAGLAGLVAAVRTGREH